MKIGVAGHALDKRVDLLDRLGWIAIKIGEDRIAIESGQRLHVVAEDPLHGALAHCVGGDLGTGQIMAEQQRVRIAAIEVGRLLRQGLQVLDALARHRMTELVWIDIGAGKRQRALETLEVSQQCRGRTGRSVRDR